MIRIPSYRTRVSRNMKEIRRKFDAELRQAFPTKPVAVIVSHDKDWYYIHACVNGYYRAKVIQHTVYAVISRFPDSGFMEASATRLVWDYEDMFKAQEVAP